MIGLTPRQRELLAYVRAREIGPSFREIRRTLRCGNMTLAAELNTLEANGFIRRLKHRARAIELTVPAKPTSYTARGQRFLFIPRGA